MENKNKTKKCIFCKRTLVDEKIPVCHRCSKKGIEFGFGAITSLGALFRIAKKMNK